MEYRNKDFNVERPAKYKEMKSEIAELYGNVFLSVCCRKRQKRNNRKNRNLGNYYFKEGNEKFRKNHVKIQENSKKLDRTFQQQYYQVPERAVEKLYQNNYDKLGKISGELVPTKPLPFGVGAESFKKKHQA